jgi:hypothetical protein
MIQDETYEEEVDEELPTQLEDPVTLSTTTFTEIQPSNEITKEQPVDPTPTTTTPNDTLLTPKVEHSGIPSSPQKNAPVRNSSPQQNPPINPSPRNPSPPRKPPSPTRNPPLRSPSPPVTNPNLNINPNPNTNPNLNINPNPNTNPNPNINPNQNINPNPNANPSVPKPAIPPNPFIPVLPHALMATQNFLPPNSLVLSELAGAEVKGLLPIPSAMAKRVAVSKL